MNLIQKKTAQKIVDTVRDVCGYHINFIDEKGIIIGSSDPKRIGTFHEIGRQVIQKGEPIEVSGSDTFYGTQEGVNIPVFYNGEIMAAIGISGEPEKVRKFGTLAQRITSLLLREGELEFYGNQTKNRVNYVVCSLADGNITNVGYIREFFREYKLEKNEEYRTLIIRLNDGNNQKGLFMTQKDIYQVMEQMESVLYTFRYPNEYILLMKAPDYKKRFYMIEKLVSSYHGALKAGLGSRQPLLQQSVSYRAAELAVNSLNTGQFLAEYDKLDFDLILGCVTEEARDFFLKKTVESLSEEDIYILQIYFEEEMSLQKTSQRLFLHKNSLQYKLNRIHRISGYNPRTFHGAVILYCALKLRV